mmetsp:Transcript_106964/g.218172  ORF Transcript_106964/g.218172 Transcript_106964/m.218172 type:complete len:207 (+) Transcript_106964:102-722(+)
MAPSWPVFHRILQILPRESRMIRFQDTNIVIPSQSNFCSRLYRSKPRVTKIGLCWNCRWLPLSSSISSPFGIFTHSHDVGRCRFVSARILFFRHLDLSLLDFKIQENIRSSVSKHFEFRTKGFRLAKNMGYMRQVPCGSCLRSERRHGLVEDVEIRRANSFSSIGVVSVNQLRNLPPRIRSLLRWISKEIRDEGSDITMVHFSHML